MARLRFTTAAVALTVITGVSVASAGPVDESARVELRAWRIAPPGQIADSSLRLHLDTVDLVNQVRADGAMPPVVLHAQVSAAAQVHAEYLASIGRLDHQGPGDTDTGDRLREAGFGWLVWGENIGAGFVDPAILVDQWLESAPHRTQLLGEFRYVGVGVAATPDGTPYWVLVLAS